MKLDIEKKDDKLYVIVSLKLRQKKNDRIKIKLEDIEKILLERNIEHGKCLKRAKITNINGKNNIGTFIFSCKPDKPPKHSRVVTELRQQKENFSSITVTEIDLQENTAPARKTKIRTCSVCRAPGHTKRTCPTLKNKK
jgi:hypothetical protein